MPHKYLSHEWVNEWINQYFILSPTQCKSIFLWQTIPGINAGDSFTEILLGCYTQSPKNSKTPDHKCLNSPDNHSLIIPPSNELLPRFQTNKPSPAQLSEAWPPFSLLLVREPMKGLCKSSGCWIFDEQHLAEWQSPSLLFKDRCSPPAPITIVSSSDERVFAQHLFPWTSSQRRPACMIMPSNKLAVEWAWQQTDN